MGKSIIVKGADFSGVAISSINLFDPSTARRNYAVYSSSDSAAATVTTYNGFCVTPYIRIPDGARKIHVSGYQASGSVRFRFSKTTSDSEAVPQGTGLAGVMTVASTSSGNATLNVPSDTTYIYFVASIFRSSSASEASSVNLSGVVVEALF